MAVLSSEPKCNIPADLMIGTVDSRLYGVLLCHAIHICRMRKENRLMFARIEPALRKPITFDNDTAFAQHVLLRTMRAMTTWFCDAYASWQKAGVENLNSAKPRTRSASGAAITLERLVYLD